MNEKITEAYLKTLSPGKERIYVWDCGKEAIRGLGVVVFPSGKISLVFKYRVGPVRRQITLGEWPGLSLADARKSARQHRGGIVVSAKDPLTAKQQDRSMLTYAEWAAKYLKLVEQRKKVPYHDRRYLIGTRGGHGHEPKVSEAMRRWESRPLDQIRPPDVIDWLQKIAERGRIEANRAYSALRSCMQEAVRQEVIHENPCLNVQKLFPENPPGTRTLTDDECQRFLSALDQLTNPYVKTIFTLRLYLGGREKEILRTTWEELELDTTAPLWYIPSPKAGIPQAMPLPLVVASMLRLLPHKPGNPYVFPGRKRGTHRTTVRGDWEKLCMAAKLVKVTMRDLRRSFGLLTAKGDGIWVASKMLRHSDVRITSRVYAPLLANDLREPAEKLAKDLAQKPKKAETS